MTNKNYEVVNRPPTVEEHKFLWESVGWGTVDIYSSKHSIENSVYAVVAIKNEKVIGMGRIVGDGAMYFYIQDVAVLPEYQNSGVGKKIIERLLEYINNIKSGAVFVGLFASHGTDNFYEQFGFKDHSPEMTGMFTVFS
ncbi:GNAT family N-acetyltransferase [Niallia sp. 03133]|uniref:GNAT family N-acetyltransferase n=1 Tax=Niallia sp. 03133 TaxID=3458060 RepID=UPI004044581E